MLYERFKTDIYEERIVNREIPVWVLNRTFES